VTIEDLEEEINKSGEMRNVAGKILTELRKAGKWYTIFLIFLVQKWQTSTACFIKTTSTIFLCICNVAGKIH